MIATTTPEPSRPRFQNSSIPIAEIAEGSRDPGNVIGMHYFSPAEVNPLVEIVRGEHLISPVVPQEYIEAGDKLIFSGDIKQVKALDEAEVFYYQGTDFIAQVEEMLASMNRCRPAGGSSPFRKLPAWLAS